mmetsp:Transcript_10216/g.33454  ORF Transcript_10216/g.33454 Transcript_10216/m.33454 type:complete len:331 (-) Transcript_10216:3896-4888(-)
MGGLLGSAESSGPLRVGGGALFVRLGFFRGRGFGFRGVPLRGHGRLAVGLLFAEGGGGAGYRRSLAAHRGDDGVVLRLELPLAGEHVLLPVDDAAEELREVVRILLLLVFLVLAARLEDELRRHLDVLLGEADADRSVAGGFDGGFRNLFERRHQLSEARLLLVLVLLLVRLEAFRLLGEPRLGRLAQAGAREAAQDALQALLVELLLVHLDDALRLVPDVVALLLLERVLSEPLRELVPDAARGDVLREEHRLHSRAPRLAPELRHLRVHPRRLRRLALHLAERVADDGEEKVEHDHQHEDVVRPEPQNAGHAVPALEVVEVAAHANLA